MMTRLLTTTTAGSKRYDSGRCSDDGIYNLVYV